MTKKIEKALETALLENGEMSYGLYEFDLEDGLDYWRDSLREDNDDYLLVVTENSGDAAMLLFEKSGEMHINEQAREKLRTYWAGKVYEKNMKNLIPMLAMQLNAGGIPNTGFKVSLVA